jgi:hypothetical protein
LLAEALVAIAIAWFERDRTMVTNDIKGNHIGLFAARLEQEALFRNVPATLGNHYQQRAVSEDSHST